MGLTSPALFYLLAILAAGLLVTIILRWRSLARPGLRAIALRFASLVTLQVLVLALIFVIVNRSAEFYSSWADLFGLDSGSAPVVASAHVGSAGTRPVVVLGQVPVRVPGDRAAGGTLQSVRLSGQLSGISIPADIFLPAGYRAGAGGSHYPVIVTIASGAASTSSPYNALRLAESAAGLIAAHRLPPVVIAMLPAELTRLDQGCLNVPAGPARHGSAPRRVIMGDTFFTEDIPAALESAYQASHDPANWAVLGGGSGGYCALQLVLTSSWVYSTAVVPDGAYTRPPGPAETGGSSELARQDNLQWLMRNQPLQPVSVLFTATGPAPGAGRAAPFAALARSPMRVSTATLSGGSWPLAGVLSWIGDMIGPHAQSGTRRAEAAS